MRQKQDELTQRKTVSKFLVRFECYLVLESPLHDTYDDLDGSFDVGSRCWEDEIVEQLYKEAEEASEKGVCNLGYRSVQSVIAVLPDDHPKLPDQCAHCKEGMK